MNTLLLLLTISTPPVYNRTVKCDEAIAKYVPAGKKLTVGVSGGRDSMCLLFLLLSSPRLCKSDLTVVNFEHGLRSASPDESRFVTDFCREKGVVCRVYTLNVKANLLGRGIETAARELRYEVFDRLLGSGEADFVLLAHHAGDQAESVLMHILRGTGLKGLVGMRPVSGRYLRPLIEVEPREIENCVKKNGVPFVTDESNFDTSYNRNFLRREALPLLAARYPVYASLNRLAISAAALDDYVESTLDPTLVGGNNGEAYVMLTALASEAASAYYIGRALRLLGQVKDVTAKHIAAARNLSGARNGAKTEFLGLTAVREYDRVIFYRAAPRQALSPRPFVCGSSYPDLGVESELCDLSEASFYAAVLEDSPRPLYFDADKLPDGAVIRYRADGDTFTPYGGGNKKLKQYFIDKKIPCRQRGLVPIVAVGSEALIVAGVEISDKVRASAETRRLYRITVGLDGLG